MYAWTRSTNPAGGGVVGARRTARRRSGSGRAGIPRGRRGTRASLTSTFLRAFQRDQRARRVLHSSASSERTLIRIRASSPRLVSWVAVVERPARPVGRAGGRSGRGRPTASCRTATGRRRPRSARRAGPGGRRSCPPAPSPGPGRSSAGTGRRTARASARSSAVRSPRGAPAGGRRGRSRRPSAVDRRAAAAGPAPRPARCSSRSRAETGSPGRR